MISSCIHRIPWMTMLVVMIIIGMAGEGAFSEDQSPGKTVKLNDSDREALAVLGEGVVGKVLPAWPIKDTAGLMPLRDGEWIYRITAGDREGNAGGRHLKDGSKEWTNILASDGVGRLY